MRAFCCVHFGQLLLFNSIFYASLHIWLGVLVGLMLENKKKSKQNIEKEYTNKYLLKYDRQLTKMKTEHMIHKQSCREFKSLTYILSGEKGC